MIPRGKSSYSIREHHRADEAQRVPCSLLNFLREEREKIRKETRDLLTKDIYMHSKKRWHTLAHTSTVSRENKGKWCLFTPGSPGMSHRQLEFRRAHEFDQIIIRDVTDWCTSERICGHARIAIGFWLTAATRPFWHKLERERSDQSGRAVEFRDAPPRGATRTFSKSRHENPRISHRRFDNRLSLDNRFSFNLKSKDSRDLSRLSSTAVAPIVRWRCIIKFPSSSSPRGFWKVYI